MSERKQKMRVFDSQSELLEIQWKKNNKAPAIFQLSSYIEHMRHEPCLFCITNIERMLHVV